MDNAPNASRWGFDGHADHQAYKEMRARAVEDLLLAEREPLELKGQQPRAELVKPDSATGQSFEPASYESGTGVVAPAFHARFGPITNEPCLPGETEYNAREIQYLNSMNARIQRITASAGAIVDASRDNTQLIGMIAEYESSRRWMIIAACEPSLSVFERTYDRHLAYVRDSIMSVMIAMDRLFTNAQVQLSRLRLALVAVRDQRTAFETTNDGAGGLNELARRHTEFLTQLAVCRSFRLVGLRIGGKTYDPGEFYRDVAGVENDEKQFAAVDELDRLRDEYVLKTIPVPPPFHFSQTKHSRRFSFAELNVTNDYSWAVLSDTLLANLDTVGDAMENAGYRIQLNSVYRNPFRSSGMSQHQFGAACDWQVFDFNTSGGAVDSADWQLLRDLVAGFHPIYIEPMQQSGVGHVHADWRGLV